MAKHTDKLPANRKIVFISAPTVANSKGHKTTYRIEAPLPESFGVGIGAEISSPFSGYAAEGTLANLASNFLKVSSKTGLITKKLYLGPDQPDINLDLKFEAYYSGLEEVIMPVMNLQLMAAGYNGTLTEALEKADQTLSDKFLATLNDATGGNNANVTDLVRYIEAPGLITIIVGGVYVLRNVFISSIQPSFSNVLDADDYPMSAEVSISITPQDPLTKGDIAKMYDLRRKR